MSIMSSQPNEPIKPRVSPYCTNFMKKPVVSWLKYISSSVILIIAITIVLLLSVDFTYLMLIPLSLLVILGILYVVISNWKCDENVA